MATSYDDVKVTRQPPTLFEMSLRVVNKTPQLNNEARRIFPKSLCQRYGIISYEIAIKKYLLSKLNNFLEWVLCDPDYIKHTRKIMSWGDDMLLEILNRGEIPPPLPVYNIWVKNKRKNLTTWWWTCEDKPGSRNFTIIMISRELCCYKQLMAVMNA